MSYPLSDGKTLGANAKVKSVKQSSKREKIQSPIYKRSTINEEYNQLTINFADNYSMQFRAFNDGIAYRFVSNKGGQITIVNEVADVKPIGTGNAYIAYVNSSEPNITEQFFNSFENDYSYKPIQDFDNNRLTLVPVLSDLNDGKRILFTEINV